MERAKIQTYNYDLMCKLCTCTGALAHLFHWPQDDLNPSLSISLSSFINTVYSTDYRLQLVSRATKYGV